MKKRVLILSQVIPQWYVDVIVNALGENIETVFVTGSDVSCNVVKAPEYQPDSFVSRFITWFKYCVFSYRWARKNKSEKFDLIFATSNPPLNTFLGLNLKKLFKAPFVIMNWDIYPQCIDYMIKNPLVHQVCKIWHWFNNRNYSRIDKMITVGDVVAQSINEKLKNPIDIPVIPIGVDTDLLIPRNKEENEFCLKNNLHNKFVVLYSGKMGYGHNIELILEAAERLKNYEEICFVFIGGGQKFSLVEKFCADPEHTNVMLFPYQPEETFMFSMACGDVGVVPEETEMARLFMPSKTYSLISCGVPVIGICSNDDDLHNTIEEKGIGFCVTDNKSQTLEKYILDLFNDREKLDELRKRARECAVDDYDIKIIEKKYSDLFSKFLQNEKVDV